VDAGKTTLTEAMLYKTGSIRQLGRVDSRDTFLDTADQERERGITIFSKQAELTYDDLSITLLDTPGHVDFSAETERIMQVLDYAVLVISGSDGVQSHTKTLWRLLSKYHIPCFIFVNKMDQARDSFDIASKEIMAALKSTLSPHMVSIQGGINDDLTQEELAVCDDELLSAFFEGRRVSSVDVKMLVNARKCFPVIGLYSVNASLIVNSKFAFP
jgi:small GTP-binding protein